MNTPSLVLAMAVFALPVLLPAQDSKPTAKSTATVIQSTDGYPLGTCVVSGKALTKKMKVIEVEGRTVKLCCGKCAKKVAKNPGPYLKKLDAAVIARQSANYPLQKCPVSGEELGEDGGKPIDLVLGGQLVKVCCRKCVKKATAKRAEILAEIQKTAYAQQIEGHAAGKGLICAVSGKPADRKGTAQMIMHGDTLVAFCCKKCLAKFKADPNKFLARKRGGKHDASSRPSRKAPGSRGDHDGDHDDGHRHQR